MFCASFIWPCFEITKNSITYEKKHIIMFLYFSLFYTYNNSMPWLLRISFLSGNKNTWQYWELLTKNDWVFVYHKHLSAFLLWYNFHVKNCILQYIFLIYIKLERLIFSENYELFHNQLAFVIQAYFKSKICWQ